MSDNYRFEEKDDPRTWYGAPDLPPDSQRAALDADNLGIDNAEYLTNLHKVIDCCGRTAYFWKMPKDSNDPIINEVKRNYKHNSNYYYQKRKSWEHETKKALHSFRVVAARLGFSRLVEDCQDQENEERLFLRNLLDPDRRKAYRYYLRRYGAASPCLLEAKYQERLKKRRQKSR